MPWPYGFTVAELMARADEMERRHLLAETPKPPRAREQPRAPRGADAAIAGSHPDDVG